MNKPFKKLVFWVGALFLIYCVFLLKIHWTLSKQIQMGKEWQEEFNEKKRQWEIKKKRFEDNWNRKIETSKRTMEEKRNTFETKKREKEEEFAQTEKRFSEVLEQMKQEEEREKAYPFRQRMADISKKHGEEMDKRWEERKEAVLTQWGWIKKSDPAPNKEDKQEPLEQKPNPSHP